MSEAAGSWKLSWRNAPVSFFVGKLAGEEKGVILLSSIQYLTTTYGRRNTELSINTAFNPVP